MGLPLQLTKAMIGLFPSIIFPLKIPIHNFSFIRVFESKISSAKTENEIPKNKKKTADLAIWNRAF